MTRRRACPPAPGPLEDFAVGFDDLFGTLAQRRGFRAYLQGLLLPRGRNKTLTALAGAEPVVGAQGPEVQRLQFFLSEAPWDAEALNARRLEAVLRDPATAPHDCGVLVIDDTGDRKKGTHTAHVGRQDLGSVGKIDVGVVAVSALWADERVYYPLHVRPYTPAKRLPKGQQDPAFRSQPQLAVELVDAALAAGVPFRAVVADCAYGDNLGFEETLEEAGLPFVLALKAAKGVWEPLADTQTPEEAARRLPWRGPRRPGAWARVERRFRDGHRETWWAAELAFAGYGPDKTWRAVVATTDPATRPPETTAYLTTNLPRPGPPARRTPAWRRPPWPRWCGCTGCGSGSSRATSRSIPGPGRPRHPAALGAGLLRLLLLLAHVVRRPAVAGVARKEGDRQAPKPPPAPAGRGRCGVCAPGWPPGASSGAAGARGRTRPRRPNCRRCWTGSPRAGRSISIAHPNKLGKSHT